MKFIFNDGGRKDAGFKGMAGDCVCRAIAIASGIPYPEVYKHLANGSGSERKSKGRSARNGIRVKRKWFRDYMQSIGFVWTPTMTIGSGCRVHLADGELPSGRLVVSISKHYTCVIDGVIYDTHNPQRDAHCSAPYRGEPLKTGQWITKGNFNGGDAVHWIERRCVYGYWKLI